MHRPAKSWFLSIVTAFFCPLLYWGCTLGALSVPPAWAMQPRVVPLTQLVVFGDSLSDTGNLWQAFDQQLPVSPPYAPGRFSNGLLWVEELHALLGKSTTDLANYAYGGAGISDPENPFDIPDFAGQVERYLKQTPIVDPLALHVVFLGGNDLIRLVDFSEDASQDEASIRALIVQLGQVVSHLWDQGARRLLFVYLPDMGRSPAARREEAHARIAAGTSARLNFSARYTAVTKAFNASLQEFVRAFRAAHVSDAPKQASVLELDLFHMMQDMLDNPARFHLVNTEEPCNPNEDWLDNTLPICTAPDTYFFFDYVHPTHAVHLRVAQLAHKLLRQNGMASR